MGRGGLDLDRALTVDYPAADSAVLPDIKKRPKRGAPFSEALKDRERPGRWASLIFLSL